MTKQAKAAAKSDSKEDLLMVTARAVERLSRLGHNDVHAEIVAAIAAAEGDSDASETE